jgi:DNA sulfur modification protein DndD
MWIERLELQNYRQYRSSDIEFAPPGKEGFTVVQGANGAGKTNLLNAITWCLYDQEYYLNPEYEGLPVYHVAPDQGGVSYVPTFVQVRLTLIGAGDKRYVITRKLNLRKDAAGKIVPVPDPGSVSDDGSHFSFLRREGEDMEAVQNPEEYVQEMLPSGIRDYFLFDGERLNSYFQETSGKQIRQAVFDVSQLELLERLIDHLHARQVDFYRDSKALSPKADEARAKYAAATAAAERASQELKEFETQRDQAERQERELAARLKEIAPGDINEKQRRREELDVAIPQLEKDLETIQQEKRRFLFSMAPVVLAAEPLIEYQALISKSVESGQIPPDYTRTFIRKLLKEHKCICGTDLNDGTPQHEAVKAVLIGVDKLSDLSTELIEEGARARSLIHEVTGFPHQLQILNESISKLDGRVNENKRELKRIQKEIGDTNLDKVRSLESQIQEYRQAKDRAIDQAGAKRHERDAEAQSAGKYKEEVDREWGKDQKHRELLKMVHFCEAGLATAEEIKESITTMVRKDVEAKTKAYFLDLIWKKNTYSDVKIDPDYKVTVEHQSGREALGTLSMGERQVLALSFVAALNRVSGFDMPLVIDSPLGKISETPKLNIAQNLPNYLKGKQVVLLVTEEEYTDEVRDALRSSVGREWRIVYREGEGGAEAGVVKYGQ